MRNIERNEISIVITPKETEKVTAIAISPKNLYLAIALKIVNSSAAYIYIFDYLNETFKISRVWYQHGDTISESKKFFISLSFSSDSKIIAGLTKFPDSNAIAFDRQVKGKIIASTLMNADVCKFTLNPKDSLLACTSGKEHFKICKIQDYNFKQMSNIQNLDPNLHFTEHVWLDGEKVVVGTITGTIYITDRSTVFLTASAFGEIKTPVSIIREFSKGFFLGGEDGIMSVWLKSEENIRATSKNTYDLIKKWYGDEDKKCKIISMCISPSEEYLSIGYSSNDIGILHINSLSLFQDDSQAKKSIKFEYICKGFHGGPISSMDVAFQRPLIATCSKDDGSIRIWNYLTNKCELGRRFYVKDENDATSTAKPLLSLAFHPSGYYLAVGFVDKVRLFHIMHNNLREYRELPVKQCTQMRFSYGGQYLAMSTVQKLIYIYHTFSLEELCVLKGPQSTINDILFSNNDYYVATIASDGSTWIWNTNNFAPENWRHTKNTSKYFGCYLFDDENGKYIVGGAENGRGIIRLCSKDAKENVKFEQEIQTNDVRITQIQMLKFNLSFAVSNDRGQIAIYDYPIATGSKEVSIFNVHNEGISKLRLSAEGRYLFSCGGDGKIAIFIAEYDKQKYLFQKEAGKDEKKSDSLFNLIVDEQLADIVLIGKNEIEDYIRNQESMKTQIDEINTKLDQITSQQQFLLQERLAEADRLRRESINQLDSRIKSLTEQKAREEQEHTDLLRKRELEFQQSVEEMQQLYEKKLSIESKKYFKLEKDKIEQKQFYEKKLQELRDSYKDEESKALETFKKEMQKVRDQCVITQKNAEQIKMVYEEKLTQQEDDHEEEIEKVHTDTGDEIRKLLYDNLRLKGSNEKKDKEAKSLMEENARLTSDQNESKAKLQELESILLKKENEIEKLKGEKTELINEIKKKEEKINKQKLKIKDLQKLKHVLTSKVNEMREILNPKEKENAKLKDRIVTLEEEFNTHIGRMREQVTELTKEKCRIAQLESQVESELKKKAEFKKNYDEIVSAIYKCIQTKAPKEYAGEMIKLYQLYCKDDLPENLKKNPKTIAEFERQLQFVETALESQYKSYIHEKATAIKTQKNRTKENIELINELNKLRVDKEDLSKKCQKYEGEIKRLKEQNIREANHPTNLAKTSKDFPTPNVILPDIDKNQIKKKGKIVKGTISVKNLNKTQDNEKIKSLIFQLQENADIILYQKLEIKRLKEQILLLLDEKQKPSNEPAQGTLTDKIQSKGQNLIENNTDLGFLPAVGSSAK